MTMGSTKPYNNNENEDESGNLSYFIFFLNKSAVFEICFVF